MDKDDEKEYWEKFKERLTNGESVGFDLARPGSEATIIHTPSGESIFMDFKNSDHDKLVEFLGFDPGEDWDADYPESCITKREDNVVYVDFK